MTADAPVRLDSDAIAAWKRSLAAAEPDTSMTLRGEQGVEQYSAAFGRVAVRDPRAFSVTVFYRPLSIIHALCELSTPRQTTRTAEDVEAQAHMPLVIAAVHRLHGTLRLTQYGTEKRYGSDQLVLTSTASPFVGRFDTVCESVMLMIPADRMGPELNSPTGHVLPSVATSTFGAATAAFVRALAVEAAAQGRHIDEEDELAAISLIRTTLGHDTALPTHNSRAVLAAAREAIDRHFADTDFTADSVAELLGIGRRQLYRHFSGSGQTPAQCISDRRLEHARQLIETHPAMTVDAVAHGSGFTSSATLRNRFRQEFGMSLREYQLRQQHRRDVEEGEDGERRRDTHAWM
ncbi:helix-turn-helix domain-containing protein [Gordonia aichiensis]